jgi:prepilin-type N-terminal cleavage/methylation domain-containing protein
VNRRRAAGFTLIEMLVAVALMGLMGVVCWRGLSFVANQRAGIESEGGELAQLVRAFAQIEHDLAERLPDIAVPARATAPELPLAVSVLLADQGNAELEIFRAAGDAPPFRVLYRLGAGGLVRQSATSEVLMLPGAAQLRIRVQAGGFWVEPGPAQSARPLGRATALEIAVDDGHGARYVKVLQL